MAMNEKKQTYCEYVALHLTLNVAAPIGCYTLAGRMAKGDRGLASKATHYHRGLRVRYVAVWARRFAAKFP